jgi:ABC-type transport system involved in multi-copper enzyme maturation permease subunit
MLEKFEGGTLPQERTETMQEIVIGFAFVTSWVFGREYSDRTVKDLLALPAPRSSIVLSKFIVVVIC